MKCTGEGYLPARDIVITSVQDDVTAKPLSLAVTCAHHWSYTLHLTVTML
jgi:hypothetical protein